MSFKFSEQFNFREYFRQCTGFLIQYMWIFENSNTKFVQAGVLDRLPNSWVCDLNSTTTKELNQIPLGYIKEGWSNEFKQFLSTLVFLAVSYERVNYSITKAPLLKGVSPKKLYEIENLTMVIAAMCTPDEILLDFGSGLGYLSQNLNLKHDFTVLAIEGDAYRVAASEQRQSKLFPKSTNNVKFIQHFITDTSFGYLSASASSLFPQMRHGKFTIVGLHACADLSPAAIKMFLLNESVTKLAIMPCCYHKLKPSDEGCSKFEHIPLSNQLRDVLKLGENFLGRPFLRLGCQQTCARWQLQTEAQHDSHGKTMFERSLVEAVLDEGQFVTAAKTPPDQLPVNAYKKYLLHNNSNPANVCSWTEEHIKRYKQLLNKYNNGAKLAEYLTCLQTCLQPICENVILLDRICYIREEADKRNITVRLNVVKLANDKLSPRCFIIKAEKIPHR
ncbi:methyltransferase-like protein 25B [Topomyia yanbarensis]|uniref:methyltransferase-like protein 25B n=1 Tax=Topomyia yanbarensis TaxID=2498891 RepID=UPI00273ADFEB|nr:methyltransferase-like protein 25B [Topomyia yanbarensis]